MMPTENCVLTINGGSSSIRFAVYTTNSLELRLHGKVDRIGSRAIRLHVEGMPDLSPDPQDPIEWLVKWLEAQPLFASITSVGHRVVHGMRRSQPSRVNAKLLAELRRIIPYDPDHLPLEIGLMEAFAKRHPRLRQVACFDTAFHRTMPEVARLLPIPRRYRAKGVERYGFHGISYAYLLEELGRLDAPAAKGRVILAHLGNGASLAAVHRGLCIDTSMGFTPTAGLMMGTRSGDLDPGLIYYLARTEEMTPPQFQRMVNHESGLLGVSGTSSDLRDLTARAPKDKHAAQAVDLFCYQVTKWIGSYAAALGGLDTLVFSAGIGENSPLIRQRICQNLDFLGVKLDTRRNHRNAAVISTASSRATVRVIPTDEERMIARTVCRVLEES